MRDIEADADISMEQYTTEDGSIEYVWKRGKIARVPHLFCWDRPPYRIGRRIYFAGVWVRVIEPSPWWRQGTLVRRDEGWWVLPLCGYYWLRKHLLMPASWWFWRMMRRLHLVVGYDPGAYPQLGNLRPYQWLRGPWSRQRSG